MLTVAEGVETPEQARWLSDAALISCKATGLVARYRWTICSLAEETVYAAVVRCAYVPYIHSESMPDCG